MLIQQLINGLMVGSVYSLVAIGYTLVFGVLNLLNMAHGDIFMAGSFVGLALVGVLGLPVWLALLGAGAGAALLGFLLELSCFRPVKPEYFVAPVLSTVAFGVVVYNVVILVFGSDPVVFPINLPRTDFHVGPVLISSVQLLALGIALALMVALRLLVRNTSLGRAMRTVAEDPVTARLLGVNVTRVVIYTFLISSALAGFAGFLTLLRIGTANPGIGLPVGIKGLAIMCIGGMGNITGAMVGGLILGLAEVLAVGYGSASYADLVVWGGLIVILLLKPSGLFGMHVRKESS